MTSQLQAPALLTALHGVLLGGKQRRSPPAVAICPWGDLEDGRAERLRMET